MRVEVALVQQTHGLHTLPDLPNPKVDLQSWKRLFEQQYRERTFIGIFIMFFQRMEGSSGL